MTRRLSELSPDQRERARQATRAYQKRHPERTRETHLMRFYGITLAEYDALYAAQDGKCAICGQPETRRIKGTLAALCVDHDHETGAIRSLLCYRCNLLLGYADDSIDKLQAAIAYLTGSPTL